MNENKIDELMQRYADSMGTCERRPVTKAIRPRWHRPAALISGLAAVAAISIAVWPRDAMAARLHRMKFAVLNAKSMEVESWMQSKNGSWRLYGHTYARDGMRRGEYRQGTPMQFTHVSRDGLFLVDYQQLDHATLEPLDPDYSAEDFATPASALDYVEQAIDMGQAGQPRTIQIHDHQPVDGVDTYAVTLDRPSDSYHAEILVNRRTDLPISAEMSVQGPRERLNYRNAYHFNRTIPDAEFALKSDKPVVNLVQAEDALTQSWQKPIATVGTSEVRDASVMADGSIWIAISTHEPKEPVILPSVLSAANGATYIRLQDVDPSAMLMKRHQYTFAGEDVYVVVFVPLQADAARPADVMVQFAKRDPWLLGHSDPTSKAEEPLEGSVKLHLRAESSDRPSYFSTLDLDNFGFQLPITVWETRAKALEKAGNLVQAARAYEVEADKWRGFIPRMAVNPLKSAARCYKSAGKLAEADRDAAMINKIPH